jgi:hypothetical protein
MMKSLCVVRSESWRRVRKSALYCGSGSSSCGVALAAYLRVCFSSLRVAISFLACGCFVDDV